MIEVMLFIFCGARIQNTKLRRHQRNKKRTFCESARGLRNSLPACPRNDFVIVPIIFKAELGKVRRAERM